MATSFHDDYTTPVTGLRWSVGQQASPEEIQSQGFWRQLTDVKGDLKGLKSLTQTPGFDRWLRESRLLGRDGHVWTVWGFLALCHLPWARQAITVLSQTPGFEPPVDDVGLTTPKGLSLPLSVLWRLRAFDATPAQPLEPAVLDALIAHNRLDPSWRSPQGETLYHLLAQASPFDWKPDRTQPDWTSAWNQATQGLPEGFAQEPLGRQHPVARALVRVLRCFPAVKYRSLSAIEWSWERVIKEARQHLGESQVPSLWAMWARQAQGQDVPTLRFPEQVAQAPLPWVLEARAVHNVVHIQHHAGLTPQVPFALFKVLKMYYQGATLDADMWQMATHQADQAGLSLDEIVVVGPDDSRWSWHGHNLGRATTVAGATNRLFLEQQPLKVPEWVWTDPQGVRRPVAHAVALELPVGEAVLDSVSLDKWALALHIGGVDSDPVDWSARASDGSTVMHVAAQSWSDERVEQASSWLFDAWVRKGVDMTALDDRGRSCLDVLEERLTAPGVKAGDIRVARLREVWQPWAARIAQLRLQQVTPEEGAEPRPRPRF